MSEFYNECEPITILPLWLECASIRPTTENPSGGIVSVNITGGTSPYTTYWDLPDGTRYYGRTLYNRSEGEYTATVIDKYGDYTATTICVLELDKDCDFGVNINETPYPTPTPTPTPSITPTNTPTVTPTPSPSPTTTAYCGSCCTLRLRWSWLQSDACNGINLQTSNFFGPQTLQNGDALYATPDCSIPASIGLYVIQGSNVFYVDKGGNLVLITC